MNYYVVELYCVDLCLINILKLVENANKVKTT